MTLSGTVKLPDGAPAETAVVELHNAGGDIVDQVQVDEMSRYLFYLRPGSWALRAWDRHGHRGAAQVALEEGEHATLDLDLERAAGGPR